MPVPILLIAGFLGAGKTTLVNHLLAHADGKRIAAVVNDFGSINIDAELIAGASDGVVSLANGCICCSLEGDLLRTLANLLRRIPRPEAIVIETSGVADPGDIVRNLMDPVIWREAPLETVLCVVDGTVPDGLDDALLRAQIRAANIIAVTKLDLAEPSALDRIRTGLAAINPRAAVVAATQGRLPMDLLFPAIPDPARPPHDPGRKGPVADRFETVSWTAEQPLSLHRLQRAIETLAPRLVRAKGLFEAIEHPGQIFLLQFAGGRATLAPAGSVTDAATRVRMVFIGEIGALSAAEIGLVMADCLPVPGTPPA